MKQIIDLFEPPHTLVKLNKCARPPSPSKNKNINSKFRICARSSIPFYRYPLCGVAYR